MWYKYQLYYGLNLILQPTLVVRGTGTTFNRKGFLFQRRNLMERYFGFYKCRRCGEKFIRVEMKDFDETFSNMIRLTNGENPTLPKLYAPHFCHKTESDIIGLADFISFEKEVY